MMPILVIVATLMTPIQSNLEINLTVKDDTGECKRDIDCPRFVCYQSFCKSQKCYMRPSCA